MVKVIVLVEGGQPTPTGGSAELGLHGVGAPFREGFSKLLRQSFPADQLDIEVRPIGSISNASNEAQKIQKAGDPFVILLDLDGPLTEKQKRLIDKHPNTETHPHIFFMVQEMEAWFFAQPNEVDAYFQAEGAKLKNEEVTLVSKDVLKGKHPEMLKKPGDHLATVVKQIYHRPKKEGKLKPANYSKGKDAPNILIRLSLSELESTFSEIKALTDRLKSLA